MGQLAPRVFVESAAVRQLEALIYRLPGNAQVAVKCDDGKTYSGIVCVRPTVQTFRDNNGAEGLNGVLRLEDATAPGGERRIWLDRIVQVHRKDAISGTFGG
ncbi:MAG TPA: DUF3247 family protein [Oleiagrimonas sp.]|nr:DUF3247 family protein [Oleiagrimonas sp.]